MIAAFATGYLLGARGEDSVPSSAPPAKQVVLGKTADRLAVVSIGERDPNGNWPMVVQVEGLDHLSGGDYYTLFMTKKGKAVATCGTFNVAENGLTTISFSVAYDPDRYDGLMLAEYDRGTHKDTPLLRAQL